MHGPGQPLLAISGLEKRFGGVHAVAGCTFDVSRGSVTGLIGPNGSGKTTTFNLICGMVRPDEGTVRLAGRPITAWRPHRVTAAGLGRTFQMTRVLPDMTLLENMLVASAEPDLARVADRANELLDLIGLREVRNEYAATLSYGQRKLLAIARAHMRDHHIVLLDEPFAGVNPALRDKLVTYIRELWERGTTYLIVDHEMQLIMQLCERIIVMDRGSVLTEGKPSEVQRDERVLEAYFGTD